MCTVRREQHGVRRHCYIQQSHQEFSVVCMPRFARLTAERLAPLWLPSLAQRVLTNQLFRSEVREEP